MNRSEIASRVADRTGVRRSTAGDAVDVVFMGIAEALARSEDVRIGGFRTFGTKSRPARSWRNPRSGKSMKIASSTVLAFKAGKLKRDVGNAGAIVICLTDSAMLRWHRCSGKFLLGAHLSIHRECVGFQQ